MRPHRCASTSTSATGAGRRRRFQRHGEAAHRTVRAHQRRAAPGHRRAAPAAPSRRSVDRDRHRDRRRMDHRNAADGNVVTAGTRRGGRRRAQGPDRDDGDRASHGLRSCAARNPAIASARDAIRFMSDRPHSGAPSVAPALQRSHASSATCPLAGSRRAFLRASDPSNAASSGGHTLRAWPSTFVPSVTSLRSPSTAASDARPRRCT